MKRNTDSVLTIGKIAVVLLLIATLGYPAAAKAAVNGKARISGHASTYISTPDDVVRDWNEIAINAILPNGPPFTAARFMTIVQLAVFEAVNATTRKYESYLGTVAAPAGASSEAAAVVAAHNVLVAYFPAQAATLGAQRDASLAAIPDGQEKTDGIAVGAASAAAMIASRATDGSAAPLFHLPTNSDPYEWQVYPGCPAGGGVFRHWPNLTPFAIESSSQFRSKPPPSLGSGVWAQDFNEVQRVGDLNASLDDRSLDRTEVARLYAVGPGHWTWNYILLQIASSRNDEITDTARTMAVMNMAINDAYISGFESKYFYNTWRPITAIPRADEDGNKWTTAGSFTPLIQTPCFPAYPSNHGTGSGAARTVLVRAYGRHGHSISVFHPAAPGIVRNYSDLKVITDDVADARIYGGIHYRYDQDAGERQGHAVGQYVYNNMLRKAQ